MKLHLGGDELTKIGIDFLKNKVYFNYRSEQGLPDRWIVEMGKKTKPVIKAALAGIV